MPDASSRTRTDPTGPQVIDVTVDRGYQPAVIHALAGLPLRLVFRRVDDDECTERVVFSSPRLERRLAPATTTIVDLPAQPPGQVRFTCGMGRYVGRIELLGKPRPGWDWVRSQVRHLQPPLGLALVLWIGSLPVIAVVAALALDAGTTLAVAAAALGVWIVAGSWALGRASHERAAAPGSSRSRMRLRRP